MVVIAMDSDRSLSPLPQGLNLACRNCSKFRSVIPIFRLLGVVPEAF